MLTHCRWPLGTDLIEGIHNKIKVIKRMANGFRDDAYFFVSIARQKSALDRAEKKARV